MQVLHGQAVLAVSHRPAIQQEPSPVPSAAGGCHTDGGPMSDARDGRADVVSVLLCIQAAATLLGVAGLLLLMGSPVYLAGSVTKAAALLWLASAIRRGRQSALVLT